MARALVFSRRAFLAACLAASAPPALAQNAAQPFALPEIPGPLRPLGGLVIDAKSLGGGGFSGVHLAPDLTLTLISDRGHWAEARLLLDGLTPIGLHPLRHAALRDEAGRPLPRGFAADAEALARLPDGTWLVAFERRHRIRAYRRLDGPGAYVAAPPGLEAAPPNGGLESLALLQDGRLFAIAETFAPPDRPELRHAWIGQPGAWMPLYWQPNAGFHPTDAAILPDGSALVLERRFSLLGGFAARVVQTAPEALRSAREGTVLHGKTILTLDDAPLPAENWEGIAVTRLGDELLVALISDDNESALQRSLLLLFAWHWPRR
ncbi:MAG: esterase-like activity of phytase family protein [Roseomonas sp.]|nr:esterase-like activity of phytase family protein [Roseomonas sp.]MCA3290125.1 esterase-like activity of phytase family protein [Roseomonas sp.]MCA3293114.1 esterase-like activity of phytase family protein [Roseomonas sp.]MCA4918213.1 esterase-like activity of phytase family protein [Roseomonas sp.]